MIERFMQNRRLIVHYYLAIGLVALFFGWVMRNEERIAPMNVITWAIYVLLFPLVHFIHKKVCGTYFLIFTSIYD